MARAALTPELKAAITKLSGKEKDKLLFRLIGLKPDLAAQLEYLLLEGGETQDERRRDAQLEIDAELSRYRFHTCGMLYMLLRIVSGVANQHVKITKDKYGEVSLNFFLIEKALDLFGEPWSKAKQHSQDKLNEYVCQRLVRTLKQMTKLDPDYHMDFRATRNRIAEYIAQNDVLIHDAIHFGLDLNWLSTTDATPEL